MRFEEHRYRLARKRQYEHVRDNGALHYLYHLPITGKVLSKHFLYGVQVLFSDWSTAVKRVGRWV